MLFSNFLFHFFQHTEHILLIFLNTGLIEGVNAHHVCGNAAGNFEEANKSSKTGFVAAGDGNTDVGNAAGNMSGFNRCDNGVHNIGEVAACQIVKSVGIAHLKGNFIFGAGLFKADNGFHEGAGAILNILTHGVKVGVIFNGCGIDANGVLAFAFAVKLLPPFCEETESGLIAGENFNVLASAIKMLSCGGVLPCRVLGRAYGKSAHFFNGAVENGFNVYACNGHGKKANCGKNAETSANIVGNGEHFIALVLGDAVENALGGVGGDENAALSCIAAILALQKCLGNAEAKSGLQGAAGLAYNVNGEISVTQNGDKLVDGVGGEGGAHEVNFGFAADAVVAGSLEQLDSSACAQIAAAYANNQQNIALFLDFISCCQNGLELGINNALGKIQPAYKIVACAGATEKSAVGFCGQSIVRTCCVKKIFCAAKINFNHNIISNPLVIDLVLEITISATY